MDLNACITVLAMLQTFQDLVLLEKKMQQSTEDLIGIFNFIGKKNIFKLKLLKLKIKELGLKTPNK